MSDANTTYTLTTSVGNISLAPTQSLQYKGLTLIGKRTADWNEPIQQNFVTLADRINTTSISMYDKDIEKIMGVYNNDAIYLCTRRMRFTLISKNNLYPYNTVSTISFYDANGDFISYPNLSVVESVRGDGSTDSAFYSETVDEQSKFFLTVQTGDHITLDFGSDFDASKVSNMVWRCGASLPFTPDTKLVIESFDGSQYNTIYELDMVDPVQSKIDFSAITFKSLKVVDLVNTLASRIDKIESDNSNYAAEISPLPGEIATVKNNQETQSATIQSTYSEMQTALKNISDFDARIKSLEATAQLVSPETINSMQSQITTMQNDMVALNTTTTDTQTNIDTLNGVLNDIKTRVDLLDTSYDHVLAADVSTLKTEADNISTSLADIIARNSNNVTVGVDLQTQINTLKTSVTDIKNRQDTASTTSVDGLVNDNNTLVNNYNTLLNDYKTLLASTQTSIDDVNTALTKVDSLSVIVNNLNKNNILDLQAQSDTAKNDILNINNTINSINTDISNIDSKLPTLTANETDLNTRITNIENNNLVFNINTQRVFDLETKANNLSDSYNVFSNDVATAAAKIASITTNIANTNSVIDTLKARLTTLEARNDQATTAEITALSDQTNNLISQVNTSIAAIDDASARVDVMTASINNANTQVDNAVSKVDVLDTKVTNIESEITDFNNRFTNISSSYDSMVAYNNAKKVDLDKAFTFINSLYDNNRVYTNGNESSITGTNIVREILQDGSELFTCYGNDQITVSNDCVVELMMVAGGGSGACSSAYYTYPCGGGGGAVYHNKFFKLKAGTYDLVVGEGGKLFAVTANTPGVRGGETSAFGITVQGGGGGSFHGNKDYSQVQGGCCGGMPLDANYEGAKKSLMIGKDKEYYKYNDASIPRGSSLGGE